jgi:hypothetical protein
MAVQPIVIDPKKASKEEIEEGLRLLGQKRTRLARIKAGEIKVSRKEMTPEMKEKAKAKARERNMKLKEILAKAKAAGIY